MDEWSRVPMKVDGSMLHLPRERFELAMAIIPRHGKRYAALDGVPARRVLDLCAGAGEFLIHAAKRWPMCWLDAVEPDPELRALLEANAPAGTLILSERPADLSVYDVIRTAEGFVAPGDVHARIVVESSFSLAGRTLLEDPVIA